MTFVLAGIGGLGFITASPWRGLLILQLVLATLAALVTYGLPRYHAPLMPALLIGAAALSIPEAWHRASPSRRLGVVALAAVFALIWIVEGATILTG
jgi:hypothetical protein